MTYEEIVYHNQLKQLTKQFIPSSIFSGCSDLKPSGEDNQQLDMQCVGVTKVLPKPHS